MCLKGIGSAVSVNPVYPDLVVGIPEKDEMLIATISGLWNSAYAVGWAFGPLIGGALYDGLGFEGFATVSALVCLAYACIMLAAAFFGVKGADVSYGQLQQDGGQDDVAAGEKGMGEAGDTGRAPLQFTDSMEQHIL